MTPLTFAPLFPGRRLLISQPDGTTKKLELLEFFFNSESFNASTIHT